MSWHLLELGNENIIMLTLNKLNVSASQVLQTCFLLSSATGFQPDLQVEVPWVCWMPYPPTTESCWNAGAMLWDSLVDVRTEDCGFLVCCYEADSATLGWPSLTCLSNHWSAICSLRSVANELRIPCRRKLCLLMVAQFLQVVECLWTRKRVLSKAFWDSCCKDATCWYAALVKESEI